jgi:flagellar motor protein MotB
MTKISRDLDLVFTVGSPQPGEIELTFLNTRFFASGDASLTREGQAMLKAVAMKLRAMGQQSQIEVEGHTDADPIKNSQFPSNWELSGARAATVVRFLQTDGLRPERLRASGLAHYKPIAPEKDKNGVSIPQNKALNRRIVVRVKLPKIEGKEDFWDSESTSRDQGPEKALAPKKVKVTQPRGE